MASTNLFHLEPADSRSLWDRLVPNSSTSPAGNNLADKPTHDAIPHDIRQEVRSLARNRGVAIHVFRLRSGDYRGVTADDVRNLARYEKIATKVMVAEPPKDLDRLPRAIRQEAERAARSAGKSIIVFALPSGDYRGVTDDDARWLAYYRSRAREVTMIAVPAPKERTTAPQPATTPRPRTQAQPRAIPKRRKEAKHDRRDEPQPKKSPPKPPKQPKEPVPERKRSVAKEPQPKDEQPIHREPIPALPPNTPKPKPMAKAPSAPRRTRAQQATLPLLLPDMNTNTIEPDNTPVPAPQQPVHSEQTVASADLDLVENGLSEITNLLTKLIAQ